MLPIILLLATTTVTDVLASVLPPSPPSSLVMTRTPAPLSSSSSALTCSAAAGDLSPEILWLRDGELVVSGEEGGQTRGQSRARMTEVTSVLEPACTNLPQVFTCLVMAGKETVSSESLVVPAQEEEMEECSQETVITTWYNNVLAVLGSRVELRCEELVGGFSRPGVWLGQGAGEGEGEGAGGRLVIKSVQWADMGLYTCITALGTARTTFLYPVTRE